MSPEDLCVGPASTLLPFVQEIFSYNFTEEPCYSRLKHHLSKVLLCHNVCPDQKFDWSKFKLPRVRCDNKKENDGKSAQLSKRSKK